MIQKLIAIIFGFICLKCTAQNSSKLMHYYTGSNFVIGITSIVTPGAGASFSAELNKYKKIKPIVELSANGLTELLSIDNNNRAYGIYSFLAGAKYKLSQVFKISFLAGVAYFENGNADIQGYNKFYFTVKPAVEINNRKDKFAVQVFMQNIFTNQLFKGIGGTAIIFRIR
jgi:hypothetical protein